jgi:uncharacterized integral membrane protein
MGKVMKILLWLGGLHVIVVFKQQFEIFDGDVVAAAIPAGLVLIFWLLVGLLIKFVVAVFNKVSNRRSKNA